MAAAGATRPSDRELDEDTTLKVLGGKTERPKRHELGTRHGGGVPPNACSARSDKAQRGTTGTRTGKNLAQTCHPTGSSEQPSLGSAPRHSLQPILTLVADTESGREASFAERLGTFGNSIGAGRTSRCGHGNARTKE